VPPVRGEITVVIADDDSRVGPAVAGLLEQEHDFRVVGHAATGDDAVAAAHEHRATLVLTDVRMPGGGPELVRRLVALPHGPVVAGFSAQADVATWTAMLAAGASAYLLKGSVAGDLPALLRRCMLGHLVVGVPGAPVVVRRLLTR
jgi:DNA-binding NarL/FixJ family response regulator